MKVLCLVSVVFVKDLFLSRRCNNLSLQHSGKELPDYELHSAQILTLKEVLKLLARLKSSTLFYNVTTMSKLKQRKGRPGTPQSLRLPFSYPPQ